MSAASPSVSSRRRLPQHLLRHRLDAVDAAAQVDAVQIELEDLALAQEDLEHHRQRRFLALCGRRSCAFDRNSVRASCCVIVLPPCVPSGAQVVERRARQRDRIDARMQVEAVILDRDHRVLEVGGDLLERHVAPLLVEPEPRPAGGVVEDRVADAAIQLVDRPGVPDRPRAGRSPATRTATTPRAIFSQRRRIGGIGARSDGRASLGSRTCMNGNKLWRPMTLSR